MKSIKEKAEEYGYTNWQSDDYHDGASEGLEFDAIGHTQKTFEAGANYVLDEIEKVVQGDLNSHSTFKLKCIKQIIEELKIL